MPIRSRRVSRAAVSGNDERCFQNDREGMQAADANSPAARRCAERRGLTFSFRPELEEMFRENLSIGRTKRRMFDPMPCIRPIGRRREFPQCCETVGHEEKPHPTGCVGEATLDDGARGRLW